MNDQPYTPPTHGKSLAEMQWDRLDYLIDQIKGTQPEGDDIIPLAAAIARANELSSVIMLMCLPYYKTAIEVLRESEKRWKIRNGKRDFEPTPGYRYNPPPAGTKYVVAKAAPAEPTYKTMTESQIKKIRAAHAAGFSQAELAEMYGTVRAHIKQLTE